MNAEELITRSRKLIPVVRERADLADRLQRLPDETLKDFIDAELLKVLVPKRFGGHELDFGIVAKMAAEVASGCGSSGWCLVVYNCHNWLAATMSERAQQEIYGETGFAMIPAPLNPAGARAHRVDGGFKVSGRWAFGSGVYHSNWAILPAYVNQDGENSSENGEPEEIVFAVPRRDFEIDAKSWCVEGMRGTGSMDIAIRDVFLPAHRVVKEPDISNGTSPGAKLHGTSLYRLPAVSAILLAATGVLLGIAQDAIVVYEERLRSRIYAFTGHKQVEKSASHMRLAEATADVDAASLMLDRDLKEMASLIERGPIPNDTRARYRLDSAYIAARCKHAVDLLVDSAGANALRDGSRIQRAFRDIHMLATHHFFEFDGGREIYGRARLGLSLGSFPI